MRAGASTSIDQWRAFVAVAQARSFVRAARGLGKSPQAITRNVAALEAHLDVKLFHRTTRSVSLTSDGARLLERARRVLDDLRALEEPVAEGPLTGTLTVTAPLWFGRMHVVPAVHELLSLHPQLDARLLLVDRVVSLADEGVDVAVRIGALPDSSLRARLVGHLRTVVVAAPSYLAHAPKLTTPDDLARHACIAFTGATPVVDRWRFPAKNVRVRARVVVNTAEAALDLAVAGLGVARLLSYQAQAAVAARALKIVLSDHEPEPSPVQLLSSSGVTSRATIAFLDLAQARLKTSLAKLG